MKVTAKKGDLLKHKTQALVLGLFEDQKLDGTLGKIDKLLNNELSKMMKSKQFKGELKDLRLLPTQGKLAAEKVLFAGLGKKKEFTNERLRRVASACSKALRSYNIKEFTTALHYVEFGASLSEKAQITSEGMLLGLYEFKKYVTVDKDKIRKVESITFLEDKKLDEVKKGMLKGRLLADNVNYIRDLVNEPADVATPTHIATEARKLQSKNLKVTVYGRNQIEQMGMMSLLGVSKGSSQEPKFIVLDYKGKNEDPVIFVGKGITFDAGGLNVKPARYMEDMRSDMAGAATVLATIKAASELGLKKRIVGIIPACENLLGENAMKQGDVLTAYNGKTTEIYHTDAEGRLILSDGLSYADKNYKAKAIIDIATLTGASIIALGYEITALVSTDDKLKKKLLNASKKTDEIMWELPIIDDYKDLMKGDSADLRNVSKVDMGPGTITAGIYLSNFVDKAPWAHLDIGASGWSPSDKDYKKKGGNGVCLRTFIQLVEDWK